MDLPDILYQLECLKEDYFGVKINGVTACIGIVFGNNAAILYNDGSLMEFIWEVIE